MAAHGTGGSGRLIAARPVQALEGRGDHEPLSQRADSHPGGFHAALCVRRAGQLWKDHSSQHHLVNGLRCLQDLNKELLPSDALENTSSASLVSCGPGVREIQAFLQDVSIDPAACTHQCQAEVFTLFKPWNAHDLYDVKNTVEEQLQRFTFTQEERRNLEDPCQRFVIHLPDLPREKNSRFNVALVGPPGSDGCHAEGHLQALLRQKCFMFCIVVDISNASPFGREGFQMLSELARDSSMFPPLIIFTKWEKLASLAGSRLTRSHKCKTPHDYAARVMRLALQQLKQAGQTAMPFVAAVNASAAKESLESQFMSQLGKLCTQVGAPLQHSRSLIMQESLAQDIISSVCTDTAPDCVPDLRNLGCRMKQDVAKHVHRYFEGIEWTPAGLACYRALPQFDNVNCALKNIMPNFTGVFTEYQKQYPDSTSKTGMVVEVVTKTLDHVFKDFGMHGNSTVKVRNLFRRIRRVEGVSMASASAMCCNLPRIFDEFGMWSWARGEEDAQAILLRTLQQSVGTITETVLQQFNDKAGPASKNSQQEAI